MKLDIKKISELKREIKIEIDKDNLKDLRDKTLNKINQKVNIPGFRKGKAPSELIERRYPDLVKEELFKEAVPFYYSKALEQENLEVVGLPKIADREYRQGNLFFVAHVEVRPEVHLDEKIYKHIKLKYSTIKVEDNEIEKSLEHLKDNLCRSLQKSKDDIDNKLVSNWSGYINEDELKEAINSELYLNKIVQRRRTLEKEITDTLLSKVKFEIPQSMVAEQQKHLVTQEILNLRSRGVPDEELKKHYDEITAKTESIAKEQIKLYYILEEIAGKENLAHQKDNLYEVVVGFILSNSLK